MIAESLAPGAAQALGGCGECERVQTISGRGDGRDAVSEGRMREKQRAMQGESEKEKTETKRETEGEAGDRKIE